MKKIWTWVAILLLLIIFCVWSKNENIYLHIRNTPQTLATPKTVHDSERIAFVLREEEGGSSLNGRFSSIAQQNSLSNTCNAASTELIIQDVSIDKSLAGDEIIELTNSILPHFLAHYKQGAITYQHQVLKISGIADSFASQREMQRLLAMSMLPTQDNSSVAVTKPIDFSITKDLQSVQAEGVLGNKDEIQTLSSLLPDTASINFTQGENRIDHGAVAVSEKILPFFMGHYTHGKIAYKEGVLNISGMVESEEDIAQMKQLLSAADIPFVNHTIIDKEALAKRQAEAERLRKELEEKQKLEARKKQAEEKATRAQKEQRLQEEAKQKDLLLFQQAKMAQMGEMVNMIAHQWRQPLNAISTASIKAEMEWQTGVLDDKKFHKTQHFIQDQCQKMSHVIDLFMQYVHAEQKQEDFTLKDVIDTVFVLTREQFKAHDIKVDVQDNNPFFIYGSKDMLGQVILNLVINARDAYDEHEEMENKTILIKTTKDRKIEIIDFAGGIDEKYMEKLFTPYFTTKEQGKGTGIGLYMSRRIMREHFKGELLYEKLENGSKFILDFETKA